MAAPISTSRMIPLVEEPPYCKLHLDISAGVEDALVKVTKGLLWIADRKTFHSVLLKESKLMQTIVRIRQSQLRREKEMQLLKRVKACLQRLPLMDRVFTIAADLLEDVKMWVLGANQSLRGEMGHLPCKQSLQFLLYLISQYHRLLHQAMSYSLSTFQYLSCLITVRQLLQVYVTFMGICARVWQVCKILSEKLTNVYKHLYPLQHHMPASKLDWVCPDLPLELTMENRVPQSDYENERKCKEFLKNSKMDCSNGDGCLSQSVDASNFNLSHSDSEEDIKVVLSVEECQVIKRKAEPSTLCNKETKKGRSEECELNKDKEKKKKSWKTDDNEIPPQQIKARTVSDRCKVLDKLQKKKKKKKKRKLNSKQ